MASSAERTQARDAACRLCGGPSKPAFVIGDRNRALGPGVFTYRRCERCDALFLTPVPPDLERYYVDDGYGSPEEEMVPEFIRRELGKLELIKRFAPAGTMVEIGPGPGFFTRTAKAAGFELTAIEMDSRYCRYLNEQLGVRAIQSESPADVLPTLAPSDTVVMWHAIEHLPNPWQVLAGCAEILRPGGILAISTPNPGSLQFRLLGRYWAHVDAPRHLQLIPAHTLERKLAELGMRRVLTTTTDPVGLELNRMGWEFALRRHPARRASSATTMRAAKAITMLASPIERRGLAGAAYTSLFVREELRDTGSARTPHA
jgi:2-polyprenyl-3-methyl-5-hydroxy-6-metoxy-1,4-benzoquinol methylase